MVGIAEPIAGTFACAADRWGPAPTLEQFIGGFARRSTLITQLATFMQDVPLVLMPVSTEPAFVQDADLGGLDNAPPHGRRPVVADGRPRPRLPGPRRADRRGERAAQRVQLLGRRFDEAGLLDAGAVIEASTGVLTPHRSAGVRAARAAVAFRR